MRLPLLLTLAFPACAADLSRIDAYVRAEMDENGIPGAAVALVRKGEIVYARGFGVRSVATGEPMTADTPVDLASVSKPLTAMAIAELENGGRIERSASAARYLPELGSGFSGVTMSQLLRHTSGLTRRDDFLAPCCGSPGEFDLDVAAAKLAAAKPRSNAPFGYANSNYVLLAAIAQRAAGRPFAALLRDLVFRPLGMVRSTLDPEEALAWGLADPHERRWGKMQPSRSAFLGWHGSSLVKSTAEDMARYLIAVLKMDTKAWREPYDSGWFIRSWPQWPGKPRVLEHGGDTWGGSTAVAIAPSWDMGAVVLLNSGAHRAVEMARGVMAIAAGLPAPAPRKASALADTDAWAMGLAGAGAAMLAAVPAFAWRAWTGWRRRERRWVWRPVQVLRASLLLGMAAYLARALGEGPTLPLAALPESLRAALRLLLASSAALLIVAAAAGLMPRIRS